VKKFKITLRSGNNQIEAVAPKPAIVCSPKWLAKFRFFTHVTPVAPVSTPLPSDGYSLSESTTGLAIVHFQSSRREATREGIKYCIEKGEKAFVATVKKYSRN